MNSSFITSRPGHINQYLAVCFILAVPSQQAYNLGTIGPPAKRYLSGVSLVLEAIGVRFYMLNGLAFLCTKPVVYVWSALEKQYQLSFGPRENLSSGFPTKRVSNQSLQLQRLARNLKFRS